MNKHTYIKPHSVAEDWKYYVKIDTSYTQIFISLFIS